MKIITWQAPTSKSTMSICPACEKALEGRWPKDHAGQEYCQVHRGLHEGMCDVHWAVQFRSYVEDLRGLGMALPEVAKHLGLSLSSVEKRLSGANDPRQCEIIALSMLVKWRREYERGDMPMAGQKKADFEEYVATRM